MPNTNRSFDRSISSAHPSQALFGLVLFFAGLLLVAAGCSSTHHVSQSEPNEYARVTEAAAGETARVHLRDGRTMKLNNLYVGPDSTTGKVPATRFGRRSVPTATIESVEFVDRGIGSLQGAGVGFAVPFGAGLVWSAMQESTLSAQLAGLAGAAGGVTLGLVGGIVGAIRGEREIYRFSASSQEAATSATAGSRATNGPSGK